ncbi:MAG: ThuA protein [Chitinophagaceae bacterium]|nr:ThuA protein [Chitinophagaceae bacterium]
MLLLLLNSVTSFSQFPRFKVLAFYSDKVERDHRAFASDAIKFFKDLTVGNGFVFDTTSNMSDLDEEKLKPYTLIMWLNDFPHTSAQRDAFTKYMESGGGWLGFHVAGYNDKDTNWPWFVQFLGGAIFYNNNWPPMPAKMVIEDNNHPITKGLPQNYISPSNEWYQWKPSPRENKNVKVLASLSVDNYPLGLKDIIRNGDTPVMWSNTQYRMVYMNIGHGDKIFMDATQNKMIIAAMRYLVAADKKGNVFKD